MSELREQVARKVATQLGYNFESLPADREIRLQYLRSGGRPAPITKEDCLNAAGGVLEMFELKLGLSSWSMPSPPQRLAAGSL
jgi:hypothetical protein